MKPLQNLRKNSIIFFLFLFFFSDTRETAFLHAISSAGVLHQVTQSCSLGHLPKCYCDRHYRGNGLSFNVFRNSFWQPCPFCLIRPICQSIGHTCFPKFLKRLASRTCNTCSAFSPNFWTSRKRHNFLVVSVVNRENLIVPVPYLVQNMS